MKKWESKIMSEFYNYSDLEPVIRETLDNGSTVTLLPRGTSMLPLIRQGLDEVVLKSVDGPLKKYDIPFYKRKNGQFVLHRIVDVKKDGYVLCGDNQLDYEYNITDDMIIGVVCTIKRDGVQIELDNKEYIKYCKKHLLKIKIKRKTRKIRQLASSVKRRLIK